MEERNTPKNFWKGVDVRGENDCWEWVGYKDKNGYGSISINNYPNKTHRYVWEIMYGYIPEGMCVCHSCDNPPCCNPKHLWLGTVGENTRDMINKGRKVVKYGEENHHHKLLKNDVLKIRRLYSTNKYTQEEIGNMFGVTKSNIECIVNYKSWKHLKEDSS